MYIMPKGKTREVFLIIKNRGAAGKLCGVHADCLLINSGETS
jgi:hypothetical protein